MTFDELFAEHNLTADERASLVAYLASLRMLATMRALMPYIYQPTSHPASS